jgi:hypothetical protein
MLEKESNERGSLYVYLRLVGTEIPDSPKSGDDVPFG